MFFIGGLSFIWSVLYWGFVLYLEYSLLGVCPLFGVFFIGGLSFIWSVLYWGFVHRVDLSDVLSAVSYSLRAEVPLHLLISGSAYSSLFNYITLLEQVRPFTSSSPGK